MDGITSGELSIDSNGDAVKPQASKPKAALTQKDRISSTSQKTNEEVQEDFQGSEILERVNNQDGADEAAKVMQWMNDNSSEDDIRAFMTGDPDDAQVVYEVSKMRMKQEAKGVRGDGKGFDDTKSQQLTEKYGAKASVVTDLSNKVASGEMTQTQAMALIAKDPTALAVAAQMLGDNAIAFN